MKVKVYISKYYIVLFFDNVVTCFYYFHVICDGKNYKNRENREPKHSPSTTENKKNQNKQRSGKNQLKAKILNDDVNHKLSVHRKHKNRFVIVTFFFLFFFHKNRLNITPIPGEKFDLRSQSM